MIKHHQLLGRRVHLRATEDVTRGCTVLADATDLLPVSLDYDETLAGVAQLAVRTVSELCIIDMADRGAMHRLQVAHSDPAHQELAKALLRYPPAVGSKHPSLRAVESGRLVRVVGRSDAILGALVQDDAHREIIGRLHLNSLIAAPLFAGDRVIGALLLGSSRPFSASDLDLARSLGRFASLEIEHARAFRDSRRALDARDRVLRTVAHDLRNPLNVVLLAAGLIAEQADAASGLQQHAERIIRAATRMDMLISDLLDVARIEGNRLELKRRTIDARLIAGEAVEDARLLAAQRAQTLRLQLPATAAPVTVDRDRTLQVLGNLLDNAIKFAPVGGAIEVEVSEVTQHVIFAVSDDGPGVPEDQRAALFEPFWRGGDRSIAGHGLGLAIARGIVEAHGGRIWAEGAATGGGRFVFALPRHPDLPND